MTEEFSDPGKQRTRDFLAGGQAGNSESGN
jgi:hypothetical protein